MQEEDFAKRLSALRQEKGASARDMSLSLGQNAGYINNIENGHNLPSMTVFFYICEYLGITPKEFFDYDNESPDTTRQLLEALTKIDKDPGPSDRYCYGSLKKVNIFYTGTGTAIAYSGSFLSFQYSRLFPEHICARFHLYFFFSDYNLRRNRCYNLIPNRTVCVRPPGTDLSVSGLNRCSKPLQLCSRFRMDPRFFKSRIFFHHPDSCCLFIDPVCHGSVYVVVK